MVHTKLGWEFGFTLHTKLRSLLVWWSFHHMETEGTHITHHLICPLHIHDKCRIRRRLWLHHSLKCESVPPFFILFFSNLIWCFLRPDRHKVCSVNCNGWGDRWKAYIVVNSRTFCSVCSEGIVMQAGSNFHMYTIVTLICKTLSGTFKVSYIHLSFSPSID